MKDIFIDITKEIYDFKELGDNEFKSCKLLKDVLRENGFQITDDYGGLETGFLARKSSEKPDKTIALIAEYDALPNIGHACGHNLISAMAVGAALTLKDKVDSLNIELRVVGTPAEETSAGKVKMVDQGLFKDVDIVLMAHPFNQSTLNISGLAITGIEYMFEGKSSHAAGSPEKGHNALQGMINFFNNINGMRLGLEKDASVHGIITHGGEAPNIIPDFSKSKFNLRSKKVDRLEELISIVDQLGEAAALSTKTKFVKNQYLKPIYDIITNTELAKVYEESLAEVGIGEIVKDDIELGSSDIGNVSYVCPTVHAMIKVTEEEIPLHTKEFAENTLTDYAINQSIKASVAMAKTVEKVANDEDLFEKIVSSHKI